MRGQFEFIMTITVQPRLRRVRQQQAPELYVRTAVTLTVTFIVNNEEKVYNLTCSFSDEDCYGSEDV